MRAQVAIVGGTGVEARLEGLGGKPIHVQTPFGLFSGRLLGRKNQNLLLVSRHGAGHKLPPHSINYRAMAWGMRHLGVRFCFATAAVGSLTPDFEPGSMAVCTDFLDLSGRNLTMHSDSVYHQDFSHPMGRQSYQALSDACQNVLDIQPQDCVYVGMNGPRFETPAEVAMLSRLGGHVVGMTAASEAVVCQESGIDYTCLAVVANMGCGLSSQPLSNDEVVKVVLKRAGPATAAILEAAEKVGE